MRCTDSDAALTFACSRGNGNVQVFTGNPAQYFDSDAELMAAKLGKEYRGFAKDIASSSRDDQHCHDAGTSQALEEAVDKIKSKKENIPVAFIPPQAVKGVPCIDRRDRYESGNGKSAASETIELRRLKVSRHEASGVQRLRLSSFGEVGYQSPGDAPRGRFLGDSGGRRDLVAANGGPMTATPTPVRPSTGAKDLSKPVIVRGARD